MKVLHIIWNAKFGGIEKLVFELAEEQVDSAELTPSVLITKKEGEFLAKFQAAKFQTHFLNFKKGIDLNPSNYKAAQELFMQHDILHFHFFNPILALLAYWSKKKIVYTEHGNFGFGRKVKKLDGLLNAAKAKFLLTSRVFVVYNSNFTRDYAEKELGLSNHPRSWVVKNGINQKELFTETDKDQNYLKLKEKLAGKFVIGTSSRFAGFKRIDRLIDSFSKFVDHQKNVLLLVGDGLLKEQLVKQVEDLNLQDQVIFAGYIENVRHYQELMDVCVFPSENEPFGLVAIETLSLGKPTLVFNNGGGLVEIIEGINKKDIVETEDQLIERFRFYKEKTEEEKLMQEERINYSKRFNINSVAQELLAIYQIEK